MEHVVVHDGQLRARVGAVHGHALRHHHVLAGVDHKDGQPQLARPIPRARPRLCMRRRPLQGFLNPCNAAFLPSPALSQHFKRLRKTMSAALPHPSIIGAPLLCPPQTGLLNCLLSTNAACAPGGGGRRCCRQHKHSRRPFHRSVRSSTLLARSAAPTTPPAERTHGGTFLF